MKKCFLLSFLLCLGCSSYVDTISRNLELPKDKYLVLLRPSKQDLLGFLVREEPPESEGPLEQERPNPCFDQIISKQISSLSSSKGFSFKIGNPLLEKGGIGIPDQAYPCQLEKDKIYSVVTEQIRAKELMWKGEEGPKETYSSDVIVAVRTSKVKPTFQEVNCSFTQESIGVSCSFPQERGLATLARVDQEKEAYYFALRRKSNERDEDFVIPSSFASRVCHSGENDLQENESCIYPLSASSIVLISLLKEQKHYVLHAELRASYLIDP